MRFNLGQDGAFWSDQRIGRLVVLRHHGVAASYIAAELGTTRDAVLGLAYRLHLAPPHKKKKHDSRKRPRPLSVPAGLPRPPKPLDPGAEEKILDEEMLETAVPFLERRADQCAAILKKRGADGLALFCGRPVFGRCSWCAPHFALYTEEPKERSDGKASYRN